MKNFKKVLNSKVLLIIICILFLSEYPIFADSNTLRLPLGEITNKRISETILIKSLVSRFQRIILDEQDMEIMRALSDEIDEEKALENFINDEEFRNYVLSNIRIGLPDNIQEIWDISDTLDLDEKDAVWVIDKVYERLKQTSISLPGRDKKIEAFVSKEVVANNIERLGLKSRLDKQLKSLVRYKLSTDLARDAELSIRTIGLDAKNTAFLTSLIQKKDCSTDIFKNALR